MNQTVAAEGNVSGGSKGVRPGRQKGTLIMNNYGYGGPNVPVVWGSFYGYPPGYGGPGSEIPAYAPTIGPGTGTGTGTFKTIWSKPIEKQQKYRSYTRDPSKYCQTTIVDGQPLKFRPGRMIPGKPMPIINDGTGETVYEDPHDEEDKKFIQDMFRKAQEDGFDLPGPREHQPCELPPGRFYVDGRDRNYLVYQLREYLKYEEQRFKRQYSYGITPYGSSNPFTGSMESRHCLTVRSDDSFCWMDKSSGIKWVGVYGIDDICVVTLSGHVDWNRVHFGLATTDSKTVLSLFRKCVLSELEDLAEPCNDKARRRFDVPFCVASATPDESGDETSPVDYAAKAIDFVRSSGLLPKVEDSGAAIRLAISTFERLIGKKCEAEEIEATVVYGRGHGIPTYKDLDISEIAAAIAIINTTSETVV